MEARIYVYVGESIELRKNSVEVVGGAAFFLTQPGSPPTRCFGLSHFSFLRASPQLLRLSDGSLLPANADVAAESSNLIRNPWMGPCMAQMALRRRFGQHHSEHPLSLPPKARRQGCI